YSINPDVCTDCGTCADVCPSEAIHLQNNSCK
ncbi:MAG: 4Fe-4S binding protein, partial [Bacteroides graminisolvens]|nr:4Fe-4S binding protein [Bacteroides graminisolvens]